MYLLHFNCARELFARPRAGTFDLGKVSRKKVAVLLDFVQMRGGEGLAQFFVHFSQTVYFGSIWGWGGRGRPLPKFFGTVVQVVLKNTLAIQKLQMFIILVTSLDSLHW